MHYKCSAYVCGIENCLRLLTMQGIVSSWFFKDVIVGFVFIAILGYEQLELLLASYNSVVVGVKKWSC